MCDAPQPLVSTALWRGGQGVTSLHASHDIGPASLHWHTPHPTPTPLRAWGAQRGDCERVRPCIAPRGTQISAPDNMDDMMAPPPPPPPPTMEEDEDEDMEKVSNYP